MKLGRGQVKNFEVNFGIKIRTSRKNPTKLLGLDSF
jgi:hypothetical protein